MAQSLIKPKSRICCARQAGAMTVVARGRAAHAGNGHREGINALWGVARFIDTAVGFIPLHVDYSDYRAVSGVKMPFHWTVTWVDGQSTTELTDVQPNAAVAAAKFAKPPASTSRGPATR